jgi:hypothetical protein
MKKTEKALFIPLKTEHFNAFARGYKTHEYRLYGPRWNGSTCRLGRLVVISKGYGKKERLCGIIGSNCVFSLSHFQLMGVLSEEENAILTDMSKGDTERLFIGIGIRGLERVSP